MSDPNPGTDAANAAMRRYWNEVAGPRWVERAEIQEARNIEVAQILLREARGRSPASAFSMSAAALARQPCRSPPRSGRAAMSPASISPSRCSACCAGA